MIDTRPLPLQAHPHNPPLEVSRVTVAVQRHADGGVRLDYRIDAAAAAVRLPAPVGTGIADGLWRNTCFEAFVAAAGGSAYREFNFSPDGRSAVYDFSRYRVRRDCGGQPAALPLRLADGGLSLAVDVPAPLLPPADELDFGFAAVVERPDGAVAYWALAHAAGRPDFHRRETFVCRLQRATLESPR